MVEFGGWDMPVQYTGIVEEHHTVRNAAGLFDISHMGRLSFGGPDALDLLQRVCTIDVSAMKDFQVRYSLICNEQGGILDDVLVYRWPYGWAMVVNASNRDKIVAWLNTHKGSRQVQIMDQTEATVMVAVQGPKAMALSRGLTEADAEKLENYTAAPTRCLGQQCVVSRTGYTGEDGVEIMAGAALAAPLWNELIARGAKPCGLGARDSLRLEAAMPLYGHELSESITPFEAKLGRSVKLDKSDFIGQEALKIAQAELARRPQRVGLELDGRRAAREGAAVVADGRPLGRVTSGCFAPTLQKSIAMAYIEPTHIAPGTSVGIDLRGTVLPARVVNLPFYRRPKN